MADDYFVSDHLEASLRVGFLTADEHHQETAVSMQPRLFDNTEGLQMASALRRELEHASSFEFSVAFVTLPGLNYLIKELKGTAQRESRRGTIITSTYLGFNDPSAFQALLHLREFGIQTRIYTGRGFHPKGYLFHREAGVTAFLGSSNLTIGALTENMEWNLRVSALAGSSLEKGLRSGFGRQLDDSVPLTDQWLAEYKKTWKAPPQRAASSEQLESLLEAVVEADLQRENLATGSPAGSGRIEPNSMQAEALRKIAGVREEGKPRALIISATGTGKTYLSALEVRAADPERVLFVAHREQILKKSLESYQMVLGGSSGDYGLLSGTSKQIDRRYVFATVQTLNNFIDAGSVEKDAFNYIVIDEAHRSAATSFKKVLDYFKTDFVLGMTATPDRTDGESIYELFNHEVPYTIRLGKALEQRLLAPFHYHGVTDYVMTNGDVISENSSLGQLVDDDRIDHVLHKIAGCVDGATPVRGLVFCSGRDEAKQIARQLNERSLFGQRLRARALSASDSQEAREGAIAELEAGRLDYLVTVDIFNEGVDIPSINQVVMLRQTKSPIVFLQQLGRGLRKAEGKEFVTVIDFIGNYRNNFMIPIALLGNNSLNKDSIRRSMAAVLEDGTLHQLSTVQFDEISRNRVLDALSRARLDSLRNLKDEFEILAQRLGRAPQLMDFVTEDSVDPLIMASSVGSFPAFRAKARGEDIYNERHLQVLTLLTSEGLLAKRPHELLVLRMLIEAGRPVTRDEITAVFTRDMVAADEATLDSVLRVLTGAFSTQQESSKYGAPVVVETEAGKYALSEELSAFLLIPAFRTDVDDLVNTGLRIVEDRYDSSRTFTLARQYSRKDAARQLNWPTNQTSTIYGYKVDRATATCPIFITYHKSDDVSASTAYGDRIEDAQHMTWFSRSNRTLASDEVKGVLDPSITKHVFIKKDDADGADFYYVGRASASNARQETMPGEDGKTHNVVVMDFELEAPIDRGVLVHFEPSMV